MLNVNGSNPRASQRFFLSYILRYAIYLLAHAAGYKICDSIIFVRERTKLCCNEIEYTITIKFESCKCTKVVKFNKVVKKYI